MSFETTVRAFAAALDDPPAATPAMTHGRMGAPDARRFAVYRNNVAVGLIGALEARYPVSRRIAGDDLFRAMARAFVRAHKPRTPVMIAYGGEFPDFVAASGVTGRRLIASSRAGRAIQSRRPALHPWIASLTLAMTTRLAQDACSSPMSRGSRTPGSRPITPRTPSRRRLATSPRSAPIRLPDTRIAFHPAARLLRFATPAASIWASAQSGEQPGRAE